MFWSYKEGAFQRLPSLGVTEPIHCSHCFISHSSIHIPDCTYYGCRSISHAMLGMCAGGCQTRGIEVLLFKEKMQKTFLSGMTNCLGSA